MLAVALLAALLQIGNGASTALAAPARPGSLAPSFSTVSGQPVLTWSRVKGAATYEVQLDTESDLSSPLYSVVTSNRRATPPGNLPTGELWWRVRGVSSTGAKGAWSLTSFTSSNYAAPTLTSPADGVTLSQPDEPVLLNWSPVAKAISYSIEIDDDSNFPSPRLATTTRSTWFLAEDSGLETDWYWRVRANFAGNYSSRWGDPWSYRVEALEAPVLVAPGNSPSTQVQDAVLDWLPVQGAVKYELEVSTDDQFNIIEERITVLSTRYARPNTYDNDQYWWRVRAIDVNNNPSPWTTSLFQFQRSWPDSPELIYPENGVLVGNPLYFEWSPVQHASSYRLQVSRDPSFQDPSTRTCATKQTTYTSRYEGDPCVPVPGDLYYWRVLAIDEPANVGSLYSTSRSLTYFPSLVQQVAPADGATVDIPTLRWQPYPQAVKYDVVVKRANGTNAAATTTFATTWTPTGGARLNPSDGPFRWTVQAIGQDGVRTQVPVFAASRTFDVSGDIPTSAAAPLAPLSPMDGAHSVRFPELRWEPMFDGDDLPARFYRIWISRVGSTSVTTLVDDFPYASATDDTDIYLIPGTYSWYVEAHMLDGSVEQSEAQRTFVIDNLANVTNQRLSLTGEGLQTPDSTCARYLSNPSPTASEICNQLQQTPVLAWDSVPAVGFYQVYLSHDRSLTNLLPGYPIRTSNTMWTPKELLADSQAGTAYYWYIQACKSPGRCSPDPRNTLDVAENAFDKRSNPVSGLTVEEHDGGSLGGTAEVPVFADEVVLSWDPYLTTNQAGNGVDVTGLPATVEARNYKVQLSTDPNFLTTLFTSPLLDQTSFSVFNRTLPEGTIFWRVQAFDGSGNALAWSLSRDLTSEAVEIKKVSPKPQLSSPVNSVTTSGTPVFRWDPLAYAARYQIEVYKNADTTFSGANRVLSGTTRQAAFAPNEVLPPQGSPYIWRVRRMDAGNLPGAWSAVGKFVVKGRGPALVSPAAGSYVSGRDAYFTWRAVPSGASYLIERRISGDDRLLEVMRTVGLSWAPTRVIENGRYEWRVTAYDLKGAVLGRSPWRSFTVDGTAPRVVKKTPTRTATRTANFVATFSEPVRNVNTTTMALFVKGKQHRLSATVKMSNKGKTATLNPAVNMRVGKFYTLKLFKGIRDRAGNPLKPLSWSVTVK